MQDTSVVNIIFVVLSAIVFMVTILVYLSKFKFIQQAKDLLIKAIRVKGHRKNNHRKTTTKKNLAQIIDSYLYAEEKNLGIAPMIADQNNRHKNGHPLIQSEVLELLKKAEGLIHYKEILSHLSGVFPDVDSNTLMIELDQLEKRRKVEAGIVGGDIHYQLYKNSLG